MFENIVHGNAPFLVAGPCAAESMAQLQATCTALMSGDCRIPVRLLRCGVWKPRTRPGGFEGAGETALQWMAQLKVQHPDWRFAVEVATPRHAEMALRYAADALWVGARTTGNPFLVSELAEALEGTAMPLMVKNPLAPDVSLWIGAMERFQQAGLSDLAAVHRGFRSLSPLHQEMRNEPLWEVPVELRRAMPQLPMLCDPSHMGGSRELVAPLSQTALNLDFDGLMIESHICPEQALTDARQQLAPAELFAMLDALDLPVRNAGGSAAPQELTVLREQLSIVDDGLLRLLAQRQQLSRQIAAVKSRHGMTLYQPRQWDAKLHALLVAAQRLDLDEHFVNELFQHLHIASIYAQQKWQKEHDKQ